MMHNMHVTLWTHFNIISSVPHSLIVLFLVLYSYLSIPVIVLQVRLFYFQTSAKEDTKAFMRTVRNNFSKKHRNKRKPRYLPIHSSQQPSYAPGETPRAPPPLQGEVTDQVGGQENEVSSQRATKSRDSSTDSLSAEQVGCF